MTMLGDFSAKVGCTRPSSCLHNLDSRFRSRSSLARDPRLIVKERLRKVGCTRPSSCLHNLDSRSRSRSRSSLARDLRLIVKERLRKIFETVCSDSHKIWTGNSLQCRGVSLNSLPKLMHVQRKLAFNREDYHLGPPL